MGLTLSSQDVALFTGLQEALLAPLTYPTVEAWGAAVLRQAELLFQADRSALFLPLGSGLHFISESIDPRYLNSFEARVAEPEPGALRLTDVLTDQAFDRRRSHGFEVWSIPMLSRLMGRPLEDFPVYHETVKPAGITYGPVLTVPLPAGEALLGLAHPRPDSDRFGEEDELQLARMLLPALKAGVHTLLQLEVRRAALMDALDGFGPALLICDVDGRVLYRGKRLDALLASEPKSGELLLEMQRVVRSVTDLHVRRTALLASDVGTRDVRTGAGHYIVRANWLESGMLGRDAAVIVFVDSLTPELPTALQLADRRGLTAREAEVALLMARGFSNREIAARLKLSPHTVRHHAEWVFVKLEVHSRKALGLKLVSERAIMRG